MPDPPPYIPAPHLIASSCLTAPELVSHFQDFSNTLRYVSTAPELVFERLVANLSGSLSTPCEVGWQENPSTLQASQQAYEDLATGWQVKSSALQASQLANEHLTAELQEQFNIIQASQRANESLAVELQEKSGALKSSQLSNEHLAADLQEKSSTLQASQLANERLTTALQEKSSALEASQRANKELTAELAKLKENIRAPGPPKTGTFSAVVKTNPVVGTFNTSELRTSQEARQQTSKTASFPNKYAMVPGVVVGLRAVDIGCHANIRVNAYPNEIQRDCFKIHLDTWQETTLYGGGCSWLAIEADDRDFQYGSYHTREDHEWTDPQIHNTRKITFKRRYSAVPKVVVWLNVIDLDANITWRIKTYASDVTATGFTIHIDTWSDSILYTAMASWMAYPADRPGVTSGCFSTLDTRSCIMPQVYNSAFEAFGTVFEKPPKLFLALNALEIDHRQNMRLEVKADNVAAAGMTWHLDAWSDTVLYSAGASYIAFR